MQQYNIFLLICSKLPWKSTILNPILNKNSGGAGQWSPGPPTNVSALRASQNRTIGSGAENLGFERRNRFLEVCVTFYYFNISTNKITVHPHVGVNICNLCNRRDNEFVAKLSFFFFPFDRPTL